MPLPVRLFTPWLRNPKRDPGDALAKPAGKEEVQKKRTSLTNFFPLHLPIQKRLSSILLPLFYLLVWLAGTASAITQLPTVDLGWQLRVGEILEKTGRLPNQDLFSHTAYGKPWFIHEWFPCLVFYLFFTRFGPDSLILLKLFITGLILALHLLFSYRVSGSFTASGYALILSAYTIGFFWDVRPQIFAYFCFLSLWIGLILYRETGVRIYLALLPFLCTLWANFHGSALLGPLLIALFFICEAIDFYFNRFPQNEISFHPALWGKVLLLSLVALLLNPHGWGIFSYPLWLTSHPRVMDSVNEWYSPNFHATYYQWFGLYLLLLAGTFALNTRHRPLVEVFFPLLFLGMGLYSVRNIPLFALASAPILAKEIAFLLDSPHLNSSQGLFSKKIFALGLVALSLLALIYRLPELGKGHWFDRLTLQSYFPQRSAQLLRETGIQGRLWNQYEWGGYLIWHSPNVPVFIDGRAEVYYGGPFDDYFEVFRLGPGWRSVLRRYHITVILAYRQGILAQALDLSPEWKRVYEDPVSVLYALRNSPDEERLTQWVKNQGKASGHPIIPMPSARGG